MTNLGLLKYPKYYKDENTTGYFKGKMFFMTEVTGIVVHANPAAYSFFNKIHAF